MGHIWKNGSHLQKRVTLGKMGHVYKNETHLENKVKLGKRVTRLETHLKERVTLKTEGRTFVLVKMGHA